MNNTDGRSIVEFGLNYDKYKILDDIKGVCKIKYGDFKYDIFNFCFVNDMLSQILVSLYNGLIPYIDLADRAEGDNNWDKWFVQPYEGIVDIGNLPVVELEGRLVTEWIPSYEAPFYQESLDLCCKLYRDWVITNEQTRSYIAKEYDNLIAGKKVLGVLCRGTDFTAPKAKGHPVQPEIDRVISDSMDFVSRYNYDGIYLATEERRIYERFEAAFPNMIITNERRYVDDDYYKLFEKDNSARLEHIQSKSGEIRRKDGLSYLSSIILLSECDSLIAGNCGGSDAAIYFNGMKYTDII